MRVSKLEPHVLGGPPADDLDSVLDNLSEESKSIAGIDEATGEFVDSATSQEREVNEPFLRFVDYLKAKRDTRRNKSKLGIALSCYKIQCDLFTDGPVRPELHAEFKRSA